MKIQAPLNTVTRKAFTIVELLVALALVLFIMSIISQVFVDSSEAFRSQRSKAELSEKLRFITQTIRADLRANHFEANRKLSDDDFWLDGPPKVGYFRIEQTDPYETNSGAFEKVYSFPNSSFPNKDQNTLLAFSTFLGGKDPRGFHSTSDTNPPIPRFSEFLTWKTNPLFLNPPDSRYEESNRVFNSPDAEVAWFLGPTNSSPLNFDSKEYVLQDEIGFPSVRTYSLYRMVWLMLPQEISNGVENDLITKNLSPVALGQKLSVVQPYPQNPQGFRLDPPVQFNFDSALQIPNVDVPNRRALASFIPNNSILQNWKKPSFSVAQAKAYFGTSFNTNAYLIADNVLSFTVEVCPEPLPGQNPVFLPLNQVYGNGQGPAVFDTWCQRDFDPNTSPQRGILGDFSTKITQVPGQAGWNVPGSATCIPMLDNATFGALPRKLLAIRVTIRLFDTNNALSPSKTTWQATVVEPL